MRYQVKFAYLADVERKHVWIQIYGCRDLWDLNAAYYLCQTSNNNWIDTYVFWVEEYQEGGWSHERNEVT